MMSHNRLFIDPFEDVSGNHPDLDQLGTAAPEVLKERWTTKRGQQILASLKGSQFSKTSIEANIGKAFGKWDLRGAPLKGQDLTGADLSDVDFFAADLEGACLYRATLCRSSFSEANLKGTNLSYAKPKDALFDHVEFDTTTKLLGFDTNSINSNLAVLLIDEAKTQERIAHFERRHPVLAWGLWALCDYGRSIGRLMLWALATMGIFSVIYGICPELIGADSWWEGFYFSAVTITTVGYGDLHPEGAVAQALATVQVLIGYALGGLTIATLAKRLIALGA